MQLGLTRRNIGRLVLLVWAVALAWLARREFGAGSVAERARRLEPSAQYFAVMAGDRQIGQLNRAVDTLVDGVRLTELLVLDVPDGDSTRQLARSSEFELTRGLRLRRFTRTAFGMGPPETLDGGLGTDSLFRLRNLEAEAPTGDPVAIRGSDPVLPAMIPLRVALSGELSVGSSVELSLLDLGSGSVRPMSVLVAAESTFVVADSAVWDAGTDRWVPATLDTVRAFRLEHDGLGAGVVTWIDAGGALLGEEVLGGYRLVRSAFEIVGNNYRRGRRAESPAWRRLIPGMVGLAGSGGPAPDTAAPVRRFVRSSPTKVAAEGRQTVRGDTVVVLRSAPAQNGDAPAPSEWLGPGWELASLRDTLVVAAAARAIGTARTRSDSLANLTRWVARTIATDRSTQGFGTALQTLRAGRGGPDGKARLLVTLARANRIPARVVTGLAVQAGGHFAHTWAEVWNERWVAADPTFGHFPASASLIRLSVGERSRPSDLVPVAASARFLPIAPGQ